MASASCVLTCRRADIEDLSRALREPPWLRDRRLSAFDRFIEMPMPSPADDHWRRTDLSRVSFDDYEPAREPALALHPIPAELMRSGVVFTDFKTAVREHESLVRDHLLSLVTPEDGKLTALHAALMTEGVFLYVPSGVAVEFPLRAVLRHPAAGSAVFPHTLVVAGKGSRVKLVDEAGERSNGVTAGVSLGVSEVVVGEGASVDHALLNLSGSGIVSLFTQRVRVERNARYHGLIVGLGGRVTHAVLETLMMAPGAESRISGMVLGGEGQHFDHHTFQDHRAPQTTSSLVFKAALQESARSAFSGLLRMRRNARQADARQTNRNLLLSPRARAESIPKLEIEVNDVRCSHASATSSVDDDQVFYLANRGLDRNQAIAMIVEGFFEEVVAGFPDVALQERLRGEIRSRLAPEVR